MNLRRLLGVTTFVIACGSGAEAGFFDQFKGDDGWLDVSDWVLENAAGFMPVPIMITEPAVGEGIGAAAVFFHAPKDYAADTAAASGEDDEFVLPNITAVAAAATSNDSWLVGAAHIAHWKDDRIRYEGVVGYGLLNLTFYGFEGGAAPLDEGFGFGAEALFLQQPISFRWKDSDVFLGAEYTYAQIETSFDTGQIIPGLPPLLLDVNVSSLGAFVAFDNVDTPFTPTSGIDARLTITRDDSALGSDFDYTDIEAKYRHYFKLGQKWFLGLRADAEVVDGDVPFFMVPFIDMRGIPALRYQGEAMVLAETELRWAFHRRLSLVAFAGAGKAGESFDELGSATTRTMRGLGVRYYVADKLGMHVGIDVARGPEDTHWYLALGSSWD